MSTEQTTFSIHIAQLLQDCDRQFEAVGFNCPLMARLRWKRKLAKLTAELDKIHAGYWGPKKKHNTVKITAQ